MILELSLEVLSSQRKENNIFHKNNTVPTNKQTNICMYV